MKPELPEVGHVRHLHHLALNAGAASHQVGAWHRMHAHLRWAEALIVPKGKGSPTEGQLADVSQLRKVDIHRDVSCCAHVHQQCQVSYRHRQQEGDMRYVGNWSSGITRRPLQLPVRGSARACTTGPGW